MELMRLRGHFLTLGLCAAFLAGCGGNGDNSGRFDNVPTKLVGGSAEAGHANGPLTEATFFNPVNVISAPDGTVYVADFDNNLIRKISPDFIVSTLTEQPLFQRPFGMALTKDGKLYVSTDDNAAGEHAPTTGSIWQVDTATGVATALKTDVGRPRGLAALPDGRLIVSDLNHSTVSIFDPASKVMTLLAGKADTPGFAEGTGSAAQFDRPYGVAVLDDTTILVVDQNNNRIRKVTLGGQVTTYAGTGAGAFADGPIATATFKHPQDVKIGPGKAVYVADHDNFRIRRISGGQVTTVVGNGTQGFVDAEGTAAELAGMEGMGFTPGSNILWVADGNNGESEEPYNRVRLFRVP